MVRKTDTLFYLSKGRHAAFPSRPSRPPRRLGQTEASPRTKPRRRCGWRRLGRKNARGSEREGRGVAKREILSIYKYATRKSKPSASSFVTSQKKSNDNEKSSQPRAQRTRHHLPPSAMSKKKSGAVRRSEKRAAATNPFTGLPLDVVLTHILRTDRLPDPIDLARLRAVCRGMRDAVAATGREIQEHDGASAAKAGCLSTMQHLQRRGRLPFLKRAGNPETAYLCGSAAEGRPLEVMQWLRANDCPWGRNTCSNAAYVDWGPRDSAMGARQQLSVERDDVLTGGGQRAPRGSDVGARERLSVGFGHLLASICQRACRGAELVARKRLPRVKRKL